MEEEKSGQYKKKNRDVNIEGMEEKDKEKVAYNFPQFPFYAKHDSLSSYPNRSAAVHWHSDMEFIVILSGEMVYSVNGEEYLLRQGKGIFVNSNQFHYGYSRNDADCEFLCIVLPLALLGQWPCIQEKYVSAVVSSREHPCLQLDGQSPYGKRLLHDLREFYTVAAAREPEFELTVAQLSFHILKYLYRITADALEIPKHDKDKNIRELQDMVGYIQKHYPEKITLNGIAQAGSVCRSNCCRIFRQLLHMPPLTYVNEYRIAKSLDYLASAQMSITEIAYQCGFSNTSYYCKTFKQSMGCTPAEYRTEYRTEYKKGNLN